MSSESTSNAPGYEVRDVRPGGLLLLVAVLTALVVGVMLLLWWLLGMLNVRATQTDSPLSPLAREAQPAPGPKLETSGVELSNRQAGEARLQSYGWVDKSQGIVHIPIDRAMQLLVERGLPEPSGDAPTNR